MRFRTHWCSDRPPNTGRNRWKSDFLFKELRENLEARLQRVDLYRDLTRGRKRPNWKKEFLAALKEASQDIGDVPPQDVQRAVREYRTSKKERPEITVVAEAAQV